MNEKECQAWALACLVNRYPTKEVTVSTNEMFALPSNSVMVAYDNPDGSITLKLVDKSKVKRGAEDGEIGLDGVGTSPE